LYTLMLSAADGVHAVAYDAVKVNVVQGLLLAISNLGTNLNLSWTGGAPPYVIERSSALYTGPWVPVSTNNSSSALLPLGVPGGFFRVLSQ
jgi:hypothetical protein